MFDIETVKHANEKLIATIEDSLRIADEGKKRARRGGAAADRVRAPAAREPDGGDRAGAGAGRATAG